MNEQELRDGLRDVMVASSPPPSMNPNRALAAAHRAHKRRRATWAGIGASATVIAVATTVVFALSPGGTQPLQVAATQPPPASQDTKPSWPNGQTDRTAHSGPRADRGTLLHDALVAALPDTLTLDPRATAPQSRGTDPLPLANTQASFEGKHGNVEVWRYTAYVPVVRKAAPMAGTAQVYVEVLTPGNAAATNVCQAATEWWTNKGDCFPQTVQGKQIGFVGNSPDERISQVAAYRYPDGTLVVAAQSTKVAFTTLPGLGGNPLTVEQLTALAVNPAFKLS